MLVRRGAIVPVCDVAQVTDRQRWARTEVLFNRVPAVRQHDELVALPVTGECELASAEILPPTAKLPEHVVGLLSLGREIIEVVDLEKLVGAEVTA